MKIAQDSFNAGTWKERFEFEIVKVAIGNIEFSLESRKLLKQYSSNKTNLRNYEDIQQRASNITSQQKIAQGIQNKGLGDGCGVIFGMNMDKNLGVQVEKKAKSNMTFDEQIEALKKLKELQDVGILAHEEFGIKKKELIGL